MHLNTIDVYNLETEVMDQIIALIDKTWSDYDYRNKTQEERRGEF